MKKLIIASTSTVHGKEYLEYILPELSVHFKGIQEILFIPYARPSGLTFEEYTEKAKSAFEKININVVGIHEFTNEVDAVNNAKGIFIGGGNTFLLLKTMYEKKVLPVIKNVVENGIPYFGTSAGSNVTGITIQNTNDMPIVYPPTFQSFGFLNFNLNPHYLDADTDSKHMGETRETRIKEFHCFNTIAVLGLREGSWLEVTGNQVILKGNLHARLFQKNKSPLEIPTETNLSFLM
ncbi:dipeptidase PepE [Lutibacter sp.]|uniref:dipeptidase PepE n=1 Tax=Lutibacter sp. TaxID=1925666 RepID=UPI0025C37961|nr:dipeptidase PepE [Lutibacter sp.]MCF6181982.1 dipeptidase PepE [Lutibacter sp.]